MHEPMILDASRPLPPSAVSGWARAGVAASALMLAASALAAVPPAKQRGDLLGSAQIQGGYQLEQMQQWPLRHVVNAPLRCSVQVVSLRYLTPGVKGDAASGSAALFVPFGNDAACAGPFPVMLYARPTELSRKARLAGRDSDLSRELAAFYASQGWVVVAPDFLGQGESDYPWHPFLQADAAAAALNDSWGAAQQVATAMKMPLTGAVGMLGHGEGGHAVLAAQRAFERQPALLGGGRLVGVVASAPPAALESWFDQLLAPETPARRGVLNSAWLVSSALQRGRAGDWTYETAFRVPFDASVPKVLPSPDASITLDQLTGFGRLPPDQPGYAERLFTPEFLEAMVFQQDAPLREFLRQSDFAVIDWTPSTPLLLCNGSADPEVSHTHAVKPALDAWAQRGAPVRWQDVDGRITQLAEWSWSLLNAEEQAQEGSLADYRMLGYHGTWSRWACQQIGRSFLQERFGAIRR